MSPPLWQQKVKPRIRQYPNLQWPPSPTCSSWYGLDTGEQWGRKDRDGETFTGYAWTACSLEVRSSSPGNTGQPGKAFPNSGGVRPHPRQVFGQGTVSASCIPSLQEGAEMPGVFLGAVMSQATETPGLCYLPETVYGERSSPGSYQHYLESCWVSPQLSPLRLIPTRHRDTTKFCFPLWEDTEPTQVCPDSALCLAIWVRDEKKSLCAWKYFLSCLCVWGGTSWHFDDLLIPVPCPIDKLGHFREASRGDSHIHFLQHGQAQGESLQKVSC